MARTNTRPKPSLKAAKKPAAEKPCPYQADPARNCVRAWLSAAEHGLESIMGAAYLLTDRAHVLLGGRADREITVTLRPKAGAAEEPELRALGETFMAELATQKVRWAIAKNNLSIREFIAEQAVLAANGALPAEPAPAAAPAEELSSEQRDEIERLIAEVEAEIKALNEKNAPKDPKKISASWEEKQAKGAA